MKVLVGLYLCLINRIDPAENKFLNRLYRHLVYKSVAIVDPANLLNWAMIKLYN
jgi:hypothetical protein